MAERGTGPNKDNLEAQQVQELPIPGLPPHPPQKARLAFPNHPPKQRYRLLRETSP